MSILIDKDTKVLVQGVTGHQGLFHTKAMIEIGTNVVAGVTPGKGGGMAAGVIVYNNVADAVKATGANSSVIFVPAPYTKDAAIEALDAGIKLIVIITEHVPFQDMISVKLYADLKGAMVIGPNCPGIAVPEFGKIGIIPNQILKKGEVGVISRSGTLTYEIVNIISESDAGESVVCGIGGDKIPGTTFTEMLELLEKDPQTKKIVIVGEIGGTAEEEAAQFIKNNVKKPTAAFIAGRFAPPGKRMGHAGAIISGSMGTADSKIKMFEWAGTTVVKDFEDLRDFINKK